MATDPAFSATVNTGSALAAATADTSLTAPTNFATVLTAGTNGTKIEDVVIQGVGTTVAGLVNLFRFDGTTYHLIDQVTIGAVTVSATTAAYRVERQYPNLWLKSGDTLRFAQTVAANVSLIKVTAFGADF